MRRKRKINSTTKKPIKKVVVKKARAPKAIKTRNAGTWSESEYFGKIRSGLRSAFRFFKPMMIALEKASRPSQSENKRIKKEYKCSHCNNWFQRKLVEIHHIIGCGSLKCYEDIVPFIQRLTEENPEGYEVLCKICHSTHHKKSKENE